VGRRRSPQRKGEGATFGVGVAFFDPPYRFPECPKVGPGKIDCVVASAPEGEPVEWDRCAHCRRRRPVLKMVMVVCEQGVIASLNACSDGCARVLGGELLAFATVQEFDAALLLRVHLHDQFGADRPN
jgi:hypothetical protein